jgi:uncharacterized protein (DUF885 family)
MKNITNAGTQGLMRNFIIAGTILLQVATASAKTYTPEQIAAESKRANEFFDKSFDDFVARHPQFASQLGLKTDYDKWDDISDAQAAADLATQLSNLATLKRDFDLAALDPQTQLSCKLFENEAQRDAEGFRFRFDNYPVTQMGGLHSGVPTFLINIHKIDNVKDAEAYIARLNGVPKLFDQLIVNLQTRADRGVIAPKFVFPLVLDASRKVIQGQPFESSGANSPLLEDFSKKVNALKDVDPATRDRLLGDAKKALTDSLKPAYEKLIATLQDLEKRATDDAGVWKFPDGAAFYEYALRRTTTTDLTASQIHELGLKEVARIQDEMRKIKDKVGFKGDLPAFFKFMREDPQFYLPDTDEGRAKYLARAVQIVDDMKKRLDELFITKPKADIVVKAVEKFREQSAGKAFYQQPAPDGSRPGMFYVNLRHLADNPTYELESLAHHEGIPGHHMQIAIAQEFTGIPKFRKFGLRYTAYTEGWGLYSELTPKEIGFYQDPYSDFGRLSLELWRAGRLVTDTGLHARRWTRDQAIKYLVENTPNTEADCVDSINRYIVMPSQATAYKIGMLKILELREKAKKELGGRFDIRQFHEVLLTNGAVPLDVLEQLVDRWIKMKQGL